MPPHSMTGAVSRGVAKVDQGSKAVSSMALDEPTDGRKGDDLLQSSTDLRELVGSVAATFS